MTNILAVDTATKFLNIVIKKNDENFEHCIDMGFSHSENFLPHIHILLDKANLKVKDLDLLICTKGPGSFTGLRIGMATLKGLSLALNIPLISIPTLDVYCGYKSFSGIIVPVIDAKKKRFYVALYKNNEKISDDLDLSVDEIENRLAEEDSVLLTGPDSELLYSKIENKSKFILDDEKYFCNSIIEKGLKLYKKNGPDGKSSGPLYIRKSEAEILFDKNHFKSDVK